MEKVMRNFFKSAKLAIFNVEKYQDLAIIQMERYS